MRRATLFFIIFLGFIGIFIFAVNLRLEKNSTVQKSSPSGSISVTPSPKEKGIVCAQDVRECPDGSFVTREGPKCEFAPCPAEDQANEKQKEVLLKVFFGNQAKLGLSQAELDKKDKDCNEVFSVERKVQVAINAPKIALLELLKGPSEKEKKQGFITNIPGGAELKRLTVENGIARAEFNEVLDKNIGGSCRAAAIRSQITQTLKQFTVIKEVIIQP